MQKTQVWSLGPEDSLEYGMAIHSNILAWKIPWTEEPGGPQSTGSQRVRHDWSNLAYTHTHTFSKSELRNVCVNMTWCYCITYAQVAFQKILQDTIFLQCFYSLTAQVDWTVTFTVSMGGFICPEGQTLGHYTLKVNGARLGPWYKVLIYTQ